jgi:hypothetical protein
MGAQAAGLEVNKVKKAVPRTPTPTQDERMVPGTHPNQRASPSLQGGDTLTLALVRTRTTPKK